MGPAARDAVSPDLQAHGSEGDCALWAGQGAALHEIRSLRNEDRVRETCLCSSMIMLICVAAKMQVKKAQRLLTNTLISGAGMGRFLFLQDMNGKAAEFPIQIDVFQLAVISVGGGIHAESDALLFQFPDRGLQIIGPHGNVAAAAQERGLHTFKGINCQTEHSRRCV
jgi:hypothetical protein